MSRHFVWYHIFLVDMYWIDVCQNNGNLVAAGGTDKSIHIFDKRELKVVDTFDDIHLGMVSKLFCFNPCTDYSCFSFLTCENYRVHTLCEVESKRKHARNCI